MLFSLAPRCVVVLPVLFFLLCPFLFLSSPPLPPVLVSASGLSEHGERQAARRGRGRGDERKRHIHHRKSLEPIGNSIAFYQEKSNTIDTIVNYTRNRVMESGSLSAHKKDHFHPRTCRHHRLSNTKTLPREFRARSAFPTIDG